jgi:hypothetical protein
LLSLSSSSTPPFPSHGCLSFITVALGPSKFEDDLVVALLDRVSSWVVPVSGAVFQVFPIPATSSDSSDSTRHPVQPCAERHRTFVNHVATRLEGHPRMAPTKLFFPAMEYMVWARSLLGWLLMPSVQPRPPWGSYRSRLTVAPWRLLVHVLLRCDARRLLAVLLLRRPRLDAEKISN